MFDLMLIVMCIDTKQLPHYMQMLTVVKEVVTKMTIKAH